MLFLGTVPAGTTIYIPFATYDGSDGSSITCTGLAVTDIEIYKNGSATQRASDAGYTLLDTDGIDFDSLTGIHGFSIDLNDNTDAGFYAVGSWYWVVVSSITVDSQTVNFVAAVFRIGPAEGVTGYPKADVSHWLSQACAAVTNNGVPEVDVTHWLGTAAATPTTAGVPEVDLTHIAGAAVSASSAQLGVNVVQVSGDGTAADNLELACDNYSVTRGLAGTALPAAAADAAGGLPISDAGGLDLDAIVADTVDGVWDELSASHVGAGSFGELIQDIDDEVDYIHAQIDNFAVAGSAIHAAAGSATITTGTESSGTYASTYFINGTNHVITVAGTTIDMYYEFDVGANAIPSEVTIAGYLKEGAPAGGDTIALHAYYWTGTSWDIVNSTIFTGITGDANEINKTVLLPRHVGTGANIGKVRIRFYSTTLEAGTTLNIDQIYVSYATILTAATISDAVWDEASAGHTDAGKAGAQLWTQVDAVKTKTDNLPADPADASDVAAAIAAIPELTQDEVRDTVIVGTYTIQRILALMLSALAGKVSGAGGANPTYRDIADTVNRLIMSISDADGNRGASTMNFGDLP